MAAEAPTAIKRQLGSAEENWTRCTAGGTGIGVFAIALNQSVGIQAVVVAAKALCENHAILRSQIVKEKKQLSFEVKSSNAPVVESLPWPDQSVADDAGVLLLPKDETLEHSLSHALHTIVSNELNFPIHKNSGDGGADAYPVDIFQVHLYTDASCSRTVLVLRFHSGACDRHSSSIAAEEFVRFLDDACANRQCGIDHGKDSGGLFPSMEDLVPKSKAAKGFFKKGLDAVGYALNSSKSSLLPFQPGFPKICNSPFRSEILSYSLGNPGSEEIFAACKREKTTFSAALSAAFLQTAAGLKELKDKKQDTFSFTKVVDCRPYFEPPLEKSALGNYSAGLPQDEQIKEGLSFWDLARQISAATEKSLAKSHQFSELSVLNMLLSQVIKHPSITPSSSMRTALFTLFVDEPTTFSWSKLQELKIAGSMGPMASMHFVGPCFSVAEALLDDNLFLDFVYTSPIHSRQQLHSFLTSALQLLADSK